jgi:hypothetical protein
MSCCFVECVIEEPAHKLCFPKRDNITQVTNGPIRIAVNVMKIVACSHSYTCRYVDRLNPSKCSGLHTYLVC